MPVFDVFMPLNQKKWLINPIVIDGFIDISNFPHDI